MSRCLAVETGIGIVNVSGGMTQLGVFPNRGKGVVSN